MLGNESLKFDIHRGKSGGGTMGTCRVQLEHRHAHIAAVGPDDGVRFESFGGEFKFKDDNKEHFMEASHEGPKAPGTPFRVGNDSPSTPSFRNKQVGISAM